MVTRSTCDLGKKTLRTFRRSYLWVSGQVAKLVCCYTKWGEVLLSKTKDSKAKQSYKAQRIKNQIIKNRTFDYKKPLFDY